MSPDGRCQHPHRWAWLAMLGLAAPALWPRMVWSRSGLSPCWGHVTGLAAQVDNDVRLDVLLAELGGCPLASTLRLSCLCGTGGGRRTSPSLLLWPAGGHRHWERIGDVAIDGPRGTRHRGCQRVPGPNHEMTHAPVPVRWIRILNWTG